MNYYISDLHIGHANAISLDKRPFNNLNEMNDAIFNNWNARVDFACNIGTYTSATMLTCDI